MFALQDELDHGAKPLPHCDKSDSSESRAYLSIGTAHQFVRGKAWIEGLACTFSEIAKAVLQRALASSGIFQHADGEMAE